MAKWLPQFQWSETTVCFADCEAEGISLTVVWGLLVWEVTIARLS